MMPARTPATWFQKVLPVLLAAVLAVNWLTGNVASRRPLAAADTTDEREFNSERAYEYLVSICRIGPRMSGSPGMAEQQKLIVDHFSQLKAQVRFQSFDAVHPLNGTPVRMNNIIVSWHPDSTERVLLACHYDTRPYPDNERNRSKRGGQFIGANDGASGVALLMELAHHLPALNTSYGVDFVLFDGEEFVMDNRGDYFLGSEHFARDYVERPRSYRYIYGVLFDMIADRNLNIYKEKNSVKFAPELTKSIWDTAELLKVPAFNSRVRHEIRDDHLPLNKIAKIPTCDLIDFDFGRFNGYWHTTNDMPAVCSGESMAQVGRVMLKWLTSVPAPKP